MGLTILQIHKRSSYEYKYIQDKYSYSEEAKCYSIADGTTQSFYSELWAEQITKDFINKPTFEPKELISHLYHSAKYFKERKFIYNSNPAKAALERDKQKKGSTATFIGVKLDREKQLSIISSGDSNIFIIRNNHFFTFPFTTVEELDSNKYFINTEKLLSGEIDETFFSKQDIPIENNDIIILSTDAISRLIIKNPNCISELLEVSNFDVFLDFCLKYWDEKILEEDDITVVIIKDFQQDYVQEVVPPTDFSFPKEQEREFIPFQQQIDPLYNHQNEFEMQQVLIAVDRVNEELKQLKKKHTFLEILLVIIISLIVINGFFQFYSNPKESVESTIITLQQAQQQLKKKSDSILNQQKEIDKLNVEVVKRNNIVSKPQQENDTIKKPNDSTVNSALQNNIR